MTLSALPTAHAVALYRQRWRVEDAFSIVKRLLGLAYFYCGAENAIQMQLWATWLVYAVLIDLTDAVAEALACPFADVSPEMVYRSLYFVTNAVAQDPTTDPIRYLADQARRLGILKRPRKSPHEPPPKKPYFPLDNQSNTLTCDQCPKHTNSRVECIGRGKQFVAPRTIYTP